MSWLRGAGFADRRERFAGSLEDGGEEYRTVTLYAGVAYRFIGACDEDCADLDLVLYDEEWRVVDEDFELDAYPIVGVTPRRTGTFHLQVIMANGWLAPCYWGADLYRGR